jgi:hypothetical protein
VSQANFRVALQRPVVNARNPEGVSDSLLVGRPYLCCPEKADGVGLEISATPFASIGKTHRRINRCFANREDLPGLLYQLTCRESQTSPVMALFPDGNL